MIAVERQRLKKNTIKRIAIVLGIENTRFTSKRDTFCQINPLCSWNQCSLLYFYLNQVATHEKNTYFCSGFTAILFVGSKQTESRPCKPNQTILVGALKKGPIRNQDSLTAAKIQAGHMANITRLYEAGTLKVAGPFAEETLAQGLFIFDCSNKSELESLLQTDPAIKTGRLVAEIHPWYTAPIGSFTPGKPKKS